MEQVKNLEITTIPVSVWKEYKELRLRALQREPDSFSTPYSKIANDPDERWQEKLRLVDNKNTFLLFARLNNKLVGMVGAGREKKGGDIAGIWGMYVDSDARGKKIGRRLMVKMLDKLKENGIHKVKLSVNIEKDPAKSLYESLGFERVGTETLTMGSGVERKLILMELKL